MIANIENKMRKTSNNNREQYTYKNRRIRANIPQKMNRWIFTLNAYTMNYDHLLFLLYMLDVSVYNNNNNVS